MAPEVIQEIGYDCVADIWSLGITALEMAEGKAPYAEIHPMRAIFMIPTKPPPSFSQPDKWSPAFIEFVSRCLVKNPDSRATASELLQNEFIKNSKSPEILADMIREAQDTKDQLQNNQSASGGDNSGTMVPGDSETLVKGVNFDPDTDGGTMIQHATLTSDDKSEPAEDSGSMIEVDLGPSSDQSSQSGNDDIVVPDNYTCQSEQNQPDINSPAVQALLKQFQQIAGHLSFELFSVQLIDGP